MGDSDFLTIEDHRRIAYHKCSAQGQDRRPGVVFFGGFKSDMTGIKALYLESVCKALDIDYLRFDYTGHGASSGRFEDGCIGDWVRDSRDIVTALTKGPQIYVGSSMGGWIALLLAREAPERVAALIGIAAAPDFTEDLIWASASGAQRSAIMKQGLVSLPGDYGDDYIITERLIREGRNHLILREPFRADFPVRLLHGTADKDVPYERALALLTHLDGTDIRLNLVRGSGHRMSDEYELSLLKETLIGLPVLYGC